MSDDPMTCSGYKPSISMQNWKVCMRLSKKHILSKVERQSAKWNSYKKNMNIITCEQHNKHNKTFINKLTKKLIFFFCAQIIGYRGVSLNPLPTTAVTVEDLFF